MAWESGESFEKSCNFEKKDTGADHIRSFTGLLPCIFTMGYDSSLSELTSERISLIFIERIWIDIVRGSWRVLGKLRNFLPKIFATASPASSGPGNSETTRHECIIRVWECQIYFTFHRDSLLRIALSFQISTSVIHFKYREKKYALLYYSHD